MKKVILSLAALFPLAAFSVGLPAFAVGDPLTTHLQEGSFLQPSRELSDQLLLGKVPPGLVQEVTLVRFPAGGYSRYQRVRWIYDFVGFPKATLRGKKAVNLVRQMGDSSAFFSCDSLQLERARKEGGSEDALREMASRVDRTKSHESTEKEALPTGRLGGLIVQLKDGRTAFLFIWLSGKAAYFEASGGHESLRGLSRDAAGTIESAFDRAEIGPVPVLYPKRTAEEANKEAEKTFGATYRQAWEYVLSSQEVRAALGEIQEIRPARGANAVFLWMDQSAQFTFCVKGEMGEGAVVVWREGSPNDFIAGELMTGGRIASLKERKLPWS